MRQIAEFRFWEEINFIGMKIFKIIVLTLVIGYVIIYGAIIIFGMAGYPADVVAVTDMPDKNNMFYLNGLRMGTSGGFCAIHRRGAWEIKLVRDQKEQVVRITDRFRFKIGDSTGDNLGLRVFTATGDDSRKFGCPQPVPIKG